MTGISIIVCCYNSAPRLPMTLTFLANQKVNGDISWEVIVVNNGSTDDTFEVAEIEWRKKTEKAEFRVVDQLQPGLSNARKKGVECARYDYLVFCDDDNWLAEDYLQKSYEILTTHPNVSILGGMISSFSELDYPIWWREYSSHFAVGRQLPGTGLANARKYLWGAGMVIRKADYVSVLNDKIPSLLQDRNGKSLTSGGDSEICARIILSGKDIFYSEELKLTHYISKERLDFNYLTRMMEGHRQSFATIAKYWKIIDMKSLNIYRRLRRSTDLLIHSWKNKENLNDLLLLWGVGVLADDEMKQILRINRYLK